MNKYIFRVIVADDEKLIADNIARKIEQINPSFHVVSIAKDGQEAYELTQKLRPDVLFSDIKMPVLDGLALIGKVSRKFPAIKTVMISGYNDFKLVRTALQEQATDYLLKPINSNDMENTLHHLERELLAQKHELSIMSEERPSDIVESVMAYIRHNYSEQINFTFISDQYGFSSAYLSRIFKEYSGTSPVKYLNEYRINIAKKLLRDTELTIRIISEKVGFPDPFHFSKCFKNMVGCSPATYREHSQNGAT